MIKDLSQNPKCWEHSDKHDSVESCHVALPPIAVLPTVVEGSIPRAHDIYEKEPDHDDHQSQSDIHGFPLPRISRSDCSIPPSQVDRSVTGFKPDQIHCRAGPSAHVTKALGRRVSQPTGHHSAAPVVHAREKHDPWQLREHVSFQADLRANQGRPERCARVSSSCCQVSTSGRSRREIDFLLEGEIDREEA